MIKKKKVYFPALGRPIKVCFYSNGPAHPTGYAKVIRELTTRLSKDPRFDISIIDEGFFGNEVKSWKGIPVIPLQLPFRTNNQGKQEPVREKSAEAFIEAVKQLQPDVVIFLEDSFTLRNFGFEMICKTPYRRLFYIPLDGDWIPDIGVNVVRSMDRLIAMSMFTQNSLAKEGFDSDMIWHGVDLELYSPISKEFQTVIREAYDFDKDDFILFNYGRNTNVRKNNQALLWIMAKYLSTAPKNHKFLFHTLDPDFEANNLKNYMERHLSYEFDKDVLDRIIFTNADKKNPPSDADIAHMIQLSDIVVTASTGEGFGLIMAEAMACGKPVVSTNYTTPWELLTDTSSGIGERGWLVETGAEVVASLNTEHAFVNKTKFVEILNKITKDTKELQKRGLNGRIFAEKYLNWDYLVEQWKEIILEEV